MKSQRTQIQTSHLRLCVKNGKFTHVRERKNTDPRAAGQKHAEAFKHTNGKHMGVCYNATTQS